MMFFQLNLYNVKFIRTTSLKTEIVIFDAFVTVDFTRKKPSYVQEFIKKSYLYILRLLRTPMAKFDFK